MRTFLIERRIPGAACLSAAELEDLQRRSREVLADLGPAIRWRHSYLTAHALFCVYEADSEALIREHGRRGGFPVDRVVEMTRCGPDITDDGF